VNQDFAEAARDYARIERIIALIRTCREAQPELAELAAAAGLSEGHLQRLFTRWAGISPKRFLQVSTLEAVQTRLRGKHSQDLLGAALDSGLSGPGRLHDLFVNLAACSPGEYASGGAAISLRHGVADTPFGPAFVAWSERGLSALEFVAAARTNSIESARGRLRAAWPEAKIIEDETGAGAWPERIFSAAGGGPERGLSLWVRGTNFQVQVWRALLHIPPGEATSYGVLATALGKSGGARAIGGAVGANPVAWLIPCHRVLRGDGALGGYRWGTERKLAMLGWERARQDAGGSSP
jgi:AraC family transcriptional regulator of adaptative response/methylated-DNA-[protein]-cysteine methyltransferase